MMRFISDNALERIGEALQDCVDRMGDYLAGAESALALVGAINAVERDLKAKFPEIRWSFFEPDVSD